MKRFLLFALLFYLSHQLCSGQCKLPDNKTLIAKARSFYVDSDSFYMKRSI